MTIFLALLKDAYRELNSKRLFWVILALSGMTVLSYGAIGFDANGMSLFFGLWKIENDFLTDGSPISVILYRSIFSTFIVGIWLAWIATILALVSTTTIFPEFVAGGSIDMVLSKPIGRVRLFIMKYLASLLFVLLQVTLFCVGIFLCVGLRVSDWEWRIFLAIPVVVVFYSYLYSFNVLIGVWTRSAIAALLLTMLFWVSLWSLAQSEAMLNMLETQFTVQAERANDEAETFRVAMGNATETHERERLQIQMTAATSRYDGHMETVGKLAPWHDRVRLMQFPFPKTGETVALLERWLQRDNDISLMDILNGNIQPTADGGWEATGGGVDGEVGRRLEADYESRTVWYIAGTSIAFEVVVLVLAGWIFVRRDY